MWNAIEVAPDVWDWNDYDAQFELAAKTGITTVVAECTHAAPEWAFHQLSHARFERADGSMVTSSIRNSSATGGFPGLCLDNEDARDLAANFLTQLVTRYRDHPALGAYDVWNECNLHSSASPYCFCAASLARFRAWLRAKYGDLETLARAWRRYSYTSWEQVMPPRNRDLYPEHIDWTNFRVENAHRLMKWRVDLIRSLDPDHPITAHGVNDAGLRRLVDGGDDPWRAAALVDGFGYTGGSSHTLGDDWRGHRWCFADLHRGASDGKPFWAAELSAGPIWRDWRGQQRGSRVPDGADLEVASMVTMAAGARGILSNRWRPLLDGPLFGACAYYDMDGGETDASRMAGRLAKWANAPAQSELWQSRPIRGEIGILVLPETQINSTLLMGRSEYYTTAVRGVYQAFIAANIQADWTNIAQINDYDVLYLPCPTALSDEAARALTQWVEAGGTLISEGCPAYFDTSGHAGQVQPNLGLDRLFGARQSYVEFTPDLMALEKVIFHLGDAAQTIAAGLYLQAFAPTTGAAAGWYDDGRIAVVDNEFGRGRTRLIGTCPGAGRWSALGEEAAHFFAGLLEWAGREPHLRCSETRLTARLHAGAGGTYLWAVNSERAPLQAELTLSPNFGAFSRAELLWGETTPQVSARNLRVALPERGALVLRLVP